MDKPQPLSDEQLKIAKQLFDQVCDLSPQNRKVIIDNYCKDKDIKNYVEHLLVSKDLNTQQLRDILIGSLLESSTDELYENKQIGDYKIHQKLSSGGMGNIYLANRTLPYHQLVAIKIAKNNTEEVVNRLRQERQILALLNHPNICNLLGGGETEQGIPYMVMEYIDGTPIDKYCKEKKLPVKDRLALFLDVCSAVSYAHSHKIIHKDIKPNNIIVTREGIPKLIDFGISKLLNSHYKTFTTIQGREWATPETACPEQCKGETVDFDFDVYPLGCLLYLLLVEEFPNKEQPQTLLSMAINKGLTSDKTLIRLLQTQLNEIALKALSKERKERFSSVEQMSRAIRELVQRNSIPQRHMIIMTLIILISMMVTGLNFYNRADGRLIKYYEQSADIQVDMVERIKSTKSEIWFSGLNFHISAVDRRELLLETLRRGIIINYLVTDPYSKDLPNFAERFNEKEKDLQRECESSLGAILNLKQQWKADPKYTNGKLNVYILQTPPPSRAYIFDPTHNNGKIILIPYIMSLRSSQSPAYVLTNNELEQNKYYKALKDTASKSMTSDDWLKNHTDWIL